MIAFSMWFKSIPSILSEGNFGRTFVLEIQHTKINSLYSLSMSLHSVPANSHFLLEIKYPKALEMPENFLPPSLITSPLIYLFVHSFAHLQFIYFVCLFPDWAFCSPGQPGQTFNSLLVLLYAVWQVELQLCAPCPLWTIIILYSFSNIFEVVS